MPDFLARIAKLGRFSKHERQDLDEKSLHAGNCYSEFPNKPGCGHCKNKMPVHFYRELCVIAIFQANAPTNRYEDEDFMKLPSCAFLWVAPTLLLSTMAFSQEPEVEILETYQCRGTKTNFYLRGALEILSVCNESDTSNARTKALLKLKKTLLERGCASVIEDRRAEPMMRNLSIDFSNESVINGNRRALTYKASAICLQLQR